MKRKLEKEATTRAYSRDKNILGKPSTLNQKGVNGIMHSEEGRIEAIRRGFTPEEDVT
jgi:hypothetical protein